MERLLKSKIFIFILIIYITYNSGSMISTTNGVGIILDLLFALIFSIKVFKIILKDSLKLIHYSLIGTIFFVLITFSLYGFSPIGAYLGIIFKSIVSVGIVFTYKFRDMANFYKKYISILAIVSLIGYFLVTPGIIKLDFTLINNINEVPYNVSFIFFNLSWTPDRNIGIFWEPGIFATYLIVALIFEISLNEKNKISPLRVLLYVVTIITTKSSAGYGLLLLVMLLFAMEFANNSKNKKMRFLLNYLIVTPFLLIILFYPVIFSILGFDNNETLIKLMPNMIFSQSRFLAVQHNLNVFFKMPVFGVGFSSAVELVEYVSDTSSSTFLLSVFGLPGILYTVLWIYSILKCTKFQKNVSVLMLIMVVLIINKEPHYIMLFSWILLYYLILDVSYTAGKLELEVNK